ncbi:hypothetical protein B5C34_00695 [Pacificimonas flava]|uniref:TIGR00341 family protein n=2 Tax=Pacificimonas TaxID=1960290 RepID=A0A219B1W2_9SPHN|nr:MULTISPECIES: DUF389 domain-containing protein [Pacificimonas]MBZ6378270.1 DUF389 domain-containing protein [Pacificimonas aurantium]OWV32113.1 hypothetical protein B5C34_00695 [Pacificimonas flava]
MRQMILAVPPRYAGEAVAAADRHDARRFAEVDAERGGAPMKLIVLNVPNACIEGLLADLESIRDLHVNFEPQGVIALRPPDDEAEDQVTDVQPLSPIEVFLGGLQSIGSWKGFLGYAAAGGVIVWVGLYTEVVYLLVAAMLIAPFAGPAMTMALGTARGDVRLLRRSLARYVAALAVSIAVCFLLSLIFRQEIATGLMVDTSMRSAVSFILPVVAGAAGALNLAQSERSSLVSGAATGMLIAASLAPPTGLVGMGLAIGEWDIVRSSAWVLVLQIAGINLAGFAVLRLYGLNSDGARFARGKPVASWISLGATGLVFAGLLYLQFSVSPELERSSLAQRITADVRQTLDEESGELILVQANADFTRADISDQSTVLITAYLQGSATETQKEALARAVQRRIGDEYDVTPLVDLTVLTPSG